MGQYWAVPSQSMSIDCLPQLCCNYPPVQPWSHPCTWRASDHCRAVLCFAVPCCAVLYCACTAGVHPCGPCAVGPRQPSCTLLALLRPLPGWREAKRVSNSKSEQQHRHMQALPSARTLSNSGSSRSSSSSDSDVTAEGAAAAVHQRRHPPLPSRNRHCATVTNAVLRSSSGTAAAAAKYSVHAPALPLPHPSPASHLSAVCMYLHAPACIPLPHLSRPLPLRICLMSIDIHIHNWDAYQLSSHVRACSQERIEASGPLGSARTTNPHLDIVESELTAAAAQGVSDGFTTYLCALLEIER